MKCSKPATHGIYCYECSIKAKRHNIKIAEKRKAERHARGLIPEIRELNGLCLKCGRKLKETEVKYCDECMNKMKINLDKGRGKSPFRAMEQIRYKKTRHGGKCITMAEWYIVYGANGRMCVIPNTLVKGRKIIKKIKCKGIKDALEQLHKFEEMVK